ncbi:MAG: branched-chain amino acid ABC transporter permease [Nitrososphaeria archaeon]|nr:branched-chain amino acid ABC transporter permease [Nitrososphaeria archaeon]
MRLRWSGEATVAVLASALLASSLSSESLYALRVVGSVAFYVAVSQAVGLVFAATGQVFLAFGALAGTSVYVSSLLTIHLGLHHAVASAAGVSASVLLGTAVSTAAAARGISGMHFGVLTLLVALAFEVLVMGMREVTFGEAGFEVPDPLSGLGRLASARAYALVGAALLSASTALNLILLRSRVGVLMRAVGEDAELVRFSGVNPVRYKAIAAALGSLYASAAGQLYAHSNGFASPSMFSLAEVDALAYLVCIVGGLGSAAGVLVAGTGVTLLKEATRGLGELQLAVFGLSLLASVTVMKSGALSRTLRLTASGRRRPSTSSSV